MHYAVVRWRTNYGCNQKWQRRRQTAIWGPPHLPQNPKFTFWPFSSAGASGTKLPFRCNSLRRSTPAGKSILLSPFSPIINICRSHCTYCGGDIEDNYPVGALQFCTLKFSNDCIPKHTQNITKDALEPKKSHKVIVLLYLIFFFIIIFTRLELYAWLFAFFPLALLSATF